MIGVKVVSFNTYWSAGLGGLCFDDSDFEELLDEFCHIFASLFFADFIVCGEKPDEVVGGELFVADLFPEECRRFVHGDDIAEIDVLFAFGNDNLSAADSAEVESFFCFHILNGFEKSEPNMPVSCQEVAPDGVKGRP